MPAVIIHVELPDIDTSWPAQCYVRLCTAMQLFSSTDLGPSSCFSIILSKMHREAMLYCSSDFETHTVHLWTAHQKTSCRNNKCVCYVCSGVAVTNVIANNFLFWFVFVLNTFSSGYYQAQLGIHPLMCVQNQREYISMFQQGTEQGGFKV